MSVLLKLRMEAGKPILRGHAHFWSVIRDLGADGAMWSIGDVAGYCNGVRPQVRDYVNRLVRGGYVEVAERRTRKGCTAGSRVFYRLLKRPADAPSLNRDGSPARDACGQRQMWTAIRRMKTFVVSDLAITASTEECRVKETTAQAYVLRLAAGGYLAVREPGRPGKPAVWRLKPSMDTGPLPPAILRSRMVFDRNRNAVLGPVEAEEERS